VTASSYDAFKRAGELLVACFVLVLTARGVLRREGIAAHGSATMPEFQGSAPSEARP
jgi:hypothetical protein